MDKWQGLKTRKQTGKGQEKKGILKNIHKIVSSQILLFLTVFLQT
jgi:hypothetical protein